jgi:hypothetical protein
MGNQPSGWVAPPYTVLNNLIPLSASTILQSTPAVSNPVAINAVSTLVNLNAGAGGPDESRMFVRFGLAPKVYYVWMRNVVLCPDPILVAAQYNGAPVAFRANAKIELITGDFNPATMTWNNQGGLAYTTLLDTATWVHGLVEVNAPPLPALPLSPAQGYAMAPSAPVYFTAGLSGYGLRLSVSFVDLSGIPILGASWQIQPDQIYILVS